MADSKSQMLISYIPGEECRVAVVENGRLEEFHHERASNISRVGNIYVGRVTNVEASIQAAFVDFGVEQHGFLHVTDLHPRYFPGEDPDETTEQVGKKTPRRERPPIQRALRRGQEITVQVLKEGVGTKGPTLTTYLSIPGRFLVMMPQMDRVGVSRKVEDEEQRRKMREILDQLELPEGFGFILRTAGFDRTKTELKRDLAYLARLWKDMEARRADGDRPRLLYSESDLLVRALRDILAPEIDEVIIDNEVALQRAARFLKIVAPRSRVGLLHYRGNTPLFHAFGIEPQIALIHAREVPLPSGGRLVIDETEALVAIDVNSGKMRDARDAETNAYRTNLEAVDEICRQLKLRDLGGIVINDLIDMRHASHRKDIEQRFKERLKRDRAKTTVLSITEFGILEMTRQRMRGSHESVHFSECPTCRGRGLVQRAESTAADALRNLAALLDRDQVAKVEMVVSPRVAGELLSGRRKTLTQLERRSGKRVDVRVSETLPMDRVSFYAYDGAGADIDLERLPKTHAPRDLVEFELPGKAEDTGWASNLLDEEPSPEPEPEPEPAATELPTHPIEIDEGEEADFGPAPGAKEEGGRKRRRRRRRRGKGAQAEGAPAAQADEAAAVAPAPDEAPAPSGEAEPGATGDGTEAAAGEGGRRRRRRRRRRRGRGGQAAEGAPSADGQAAPEPEAIHADAPPPEPEGPRGDSWDLEPAELPAVGSAEAADADEEEAEGTTNGQAVAPESKQEGQAEGGGRKRRRRRRRRRGGGSGADGRAGPEKDSGSGSAPQKPAPEPRAEPTPSAGQPKRFLYSSRRKLSPGEAANRPRE